MKLVKQNKQACAELAQRVANITRDVRATIRGKEHLVEDNLRMALEQLNKCVLIILARQMCRSRRLGISDFNEIKAFLEAESKRKLFSKALNRFDVSARITEFSTKVSDSMSTFQVRSAIAMT